MPSTGASARARHGWRWSGRRGGIFHFSTHTGLNRIGTWAPSTSTTIVVQGIPLTSVGTISHPALSGSSLLTSSRRWRSTSAATANSVADQRSALTACCRGNAAGLGGFTLITRISLTTLQPTGIGFFGLLGSVAALAATTVLSALVEAIGLGFERGTHTNWQLVRNDATGAPTLVDLGAGFPVVTDGMRGQPHRSFMKDLLILGTLIVQDKGHASIDSYRHKGRFYNVQQHDL